jgi:hypothetical protein
MPCYVCNHNQVKDIDRALLTGVSLNSLSKTYGFSTEALQRHHQHLKLKMAQAHQRFHDGLHQGLFCKLNLVMEMVLGVVRGARAGEDFKLFLQATREFTRLVSLMVKMEARLEPEMIYCLMASPQWDLQDSLLPNAFQALAGTRQTLKVNLYAPCPEPEPDQDKAPYATLENLTDDLLPEVPPLPERPQATQPGTDNLETGTAKRPKNQREISAKLARKIPAANNNYKLIQEDKVC